MAHNIYGPFRGSGPGPFTPSTPLLDGPAIGCKYYDSSVASQKAALGAETFAIFAFFGIFRKSFCQGIIYVQNLRNFLPVKLSAPKIRRLHMNYQRKKEQKNKT